MTHPSTCTGCPECDTEMRAALRAFSVGDYKTYCDWLTEQGRKRTYNVQEDTIMENDTPTIDPCAPGIALLRAAAATPASSFEAQWKTERLATLAAEHDEVAQLRTAHEARQATPPKPRVLTAAELQAYEPPDSYREGIKALQAKENR